jgi:hypothetical protein
VVIESPNISGEPQFEKQGSAKRFGAFCGEHEGKALEVNLVIGVPDGI